MKISRIRYKANENLLVANLRIYDIQKNVVKNVNKKLKKTYFEERIPKGKKCKCFVDFS